MATRKSKSGDWCEQNSLEGSVAYMAAKNAALRSKVRSGGWNAPRPPEPSLVAIPLGENDAVSTNSAIAPALAEQLPSMR